MIGQTVNVLNYNECPIYIKLQKDESSIGKSKDGINPSEIQLDIADLKYVNSNSDAIKGGWLMFPDENKEEIYTMLKIINWKQILTNDKIKYIILHPSYDGLKQILEIDNLSNFDRVRMIFQKLKYEDNYDISLRVADLINKRYKELVNRKRNTSISLQPREKKQLVSNTQDFSKLKEQNDKLQEQINQMQAMMNNLINATNMMQKPIEENNDVENNTTEKTNTETNETTVKPKRGRKPKN